MAVTPPHCQSVVSFYERKSKAPWHGLGNSSKGGEYGWRQLFLLGRKLNSQVGTLEDLRINDVGRAAARQHFGHLSSSGGLEFEHRFLRMERGARADAVDASR